MKNWDQLPEYMKCEAVRPYYESLRRKKISLLVKRIGDIILSSALIVLLLPIFVFLGIWIKMDSEGDIFFRQVRVTTNGKEFRIFKFRTMVSNADKIGTQVTMKGDSRITKVGERIRKNRLDELPQLFNIFLGDMSFVGTRPEVPKYVEQYTEEMRATFLLPAGVTSRASIEYKDEDWLLEKAKDVDEVYVHKILPEKMKYNLDAIKKFSIISDIKTMLATVVAVLQ